MKEWATVLFVSKKWGERKKCLCRHRNAALERQALMRKNIFHAHCGGEVSASDVNWLLLCSQQSVHGSWHSLHMDLEEISQVNWNSYTCIPHVKDPDKVIQGFFIMAASAHSWLTPSFPFTKFLSSELLSIPSVPVSVDVEDNSDPDAGPCTWSCWINFTMVTWATFLACSGPSNCIPFFKHHWSWCHLQTCWECNSIPLCHQ